jgi:ADP-ribose pyrophosphatase YjhB (NUDIX family)
MSTLKTLSFIFDNKNDHLLLHMIVEDGPLKRKHSGIKGNIELQEDINSAAIRSIWEASNLEIQEMVLRGVVKTIQETSQTSTVYFVYESALFSGELEKKIPGQLKWVDILNIFNLQMESVVQEIMPNLLDGESFFEGTFRINEQDEVLESDIRICNTI